MHFTLTSPHIFLDGIVVLVDAVEFVDALAALIGVILCCVVALVVACGGVIICCVGVVVVVAGGGAINCCIVVVVLRPQIVLFPLCRAKFLQILLVCFFEEVDVFLMDEILKVCPFKTENGEPDESSDVVVASFSCIFVCREIDDSRRHFG